jgi:hypothetical protein
MNRGQWVRVGSGLRAYVVEISGSRANPRFKDGSNVKVLTFSSNNCSDGLMSSRQEKVPTNGRQDWWWLNIR